MDINRNQIFAVGLVFLLLGLEFLMVDALILTPEATKILAEEMEHPVATATNGVDSLLGTQSSVPSTTLHPPIWLGWCLTSIGFVLVLHSLAMPKP
jgi:hypothetical protein